MGEKRGEWDERVKARAILSTHELLMTALIKTAIFRDRERNKETIRINRGGMRNGGDLEAEKWTQ